MFEAVCASCWKKFGVDDRHAGRRIKCPGCGAPVTVSDPPAPAAAAPPVVPPVAPAPPRVVSTAARACPHCGAPINRRGAAAGVLAGCLGLASAAVGVALLLLVGGFALVVYVAATTAPVRPDLQAPAPAFPAGAAVTLSRPGGAGNTLLARERFDLPALLDTTPGAFGRYQSLAGSGRVFGVANGTRARVISAEGSAVRVRIAEGPQSGREAWCPAEHVSEE